MKSADGQPAKIDKSPTVHDVIRDLYAIAAFYVANPDHPLPDIITLSHRADEATVRAVAAKHNKDGRVYGSQPQTHHDLPGTRVNVGLIVGVIK